MTPHLLSDIRRDIRHDLGRQDAPGGSRPSPSGTTTPWGRCCRPLETRLGPPGGGNGPLNGPAAESAEGHPSEGRSWGAPPALHPIRPDLDIRLPRGYRLGERLAEATVALAVIWLLAEGVLWLV